MEVQNTTTQNKVTPPPMPEVAEEAVMGEASVKLPPREFPPRVELIKEIHKRNVDAGWWPEGRSIEAVKLLIVSELVEAFEEVRDNKPPVYVVQDGKVVPIESLDWVSFTMTNGITDQVTYQKPEGMLIEFADVMIRCYDLIGFIGGAEKFDEQFANFRFDKYPRGEHVEAKLIWGCVELMAGQDFQMERLVSVIDAIQDHCEFNGWDLHKAIDIKLQYNLTRPFRHGGKRY